MSFGIAAHRFLTASFVDDNGGPVLVYSINPTPSTRTLLADYAIAARPNPAGISLYYKTNPQAVPPLVTPISSRVKFRFALTQNAVPPQSLYDGILGAQILLDNLDDADALIPEGVLTAGTAVAVEDHITIGSTGAVAPVDFIDDEAVTMRAAGILDLYWDGPQDSVLANTGQSYSAVFTRH